MKSAIKSLIIAATAAATLSAHADEISEEKSEFPEQYKFSIAYSIETADITPSDFSASQFSFFWQLKPYLAVGGAVGTMQDLALNGIFGTLDAQSRFFVKPAVEFYSPRFLNIMSVSAQAYLMLNQAYRGYVVCSEHGNFDMFESRNFNAGAQLMLNLDCHRVRFSAGLGLSTLGIKGNINHSASNPYYDPEIGTPYAIRCRPVPTVNFGIAYRFRK